MSAGLGGVVQSTVASITGRLDMVRAGTTDEIPAKLAVC